jgi:hypothetical protein
METGTFTESESTMWAKAHYGHDIYCQPEGETMYEDEEIEPPTLKPIIIDVGAELDHAKYLFAAKDLCRTANRRVEVRFICGIIRLCHIIDYSPELGGMAKITRIEVIPL